MRDGGRGRPASEYSQHESPLPNERTDALYWTE